MRGRSIELALWTIGVCLIVLLMKVARLSALTPPVSAVHYWPWVALGGILSLLVVIARFSRRRLPFGGRP